jgi:hypothetical protein
MNSSEKSSAAHHTTVAAERSADSMSPCTSSTWPPGAAHEEASRGGTAAARARSAFSARSCRLAASSTPTASRTPHSRCACTTHRPTCDRRSRFKVGWRGNPAIGIRTPEPRSKNVSFSASSTAAASVRIPLVVISPYSYASDPDTFSIFKSSCGVVQYPSPPILPYPDQSYTLSKTMSTTGASFLETELKPASLI